MLIEAVINDLLQLSDKLDGWLTDYLTLFQVLA